MWCAIRTYAEHAKELDNPVQAQPIFFTKPMNCLFDGHHLPSHQVIEYHHEIELVVRLNQMGRPDAITVGIDFTDRNAQSKLRASQFPWARGKSFMNSAMIGSWVVWDSDVETLNQMNQLRLELHVNGELRQAAWTHEMSIPIVQQLEDLCRWAPIQEGDMVFTGTPSGVGQLQPNDEVQATLKGANGEILSQFSFTYG